MKKKGLVVETLAQEFCEIDAERLELDRRIRALKKRLKDLQDGIQEFVGTTDALDVPVVARIGKFVVSQIKRHRAVNSYEFDFVEFKVVKIN